MAASTDVQPAITAWGHTWRLLAVLLLSAGALAATFEDGQFDGRPGLLLIDLGAGVVALVMALGRRRQPLAVAIVTGVLGVVSVSSGGPAVLALTSLATRRETRSIALAAGVHVAASIGYVVAISGDGQVAGDVFGSLVPIAAAVGWGLFVGSRRELVFDLRQRAERAEAEQELRAAEARAHERTRIAREMHDVVAHRISQVSMRAGALAFRDDLSVEQMRAESTVIRDAANEALRDLRSVLHVLRDAASGAPVEQPQPTYADLAQLVDEARRSGAHVELDDRLNADVPAEIGRTLYRVVQEGITNASKHAPGARLHIQLTSTIGAADARPGIELTLTNRLGFGSSTPGAGLGLIGIAERVGVAGGSVEHGVEDGAFILRAWLPCPT